MSIPVQGYCAGGIVTGVLARPGHLREALEGSSQVIVEGATWAPLDGSPAHASGAMPIVVDDLVAAVPDEELAGPVHAAWHAIRLEAGPYLIEGELPTMPGFDPGRALTRPTGEFVLLRDVRVTLLDRPEAGAASHPQALVNRYSVDRVGADLMLGFFFPGARMDPQVAETAAGPPVTHGA